jgi:YVTN family beta-propeller protein
MVGDRPVGAAVNPATNRIYTANQDSNSVSVIDGSTNTVVTTIPVGSHPHGVAVNPSTNRVYVANYDSGNVSVIDGSSDGVLTAIPVGLHPYAVTVDPATNRIYASNHDSGTGTYVVSVIDGVTNSVLASIPTGDYKPEGVAANPTTNRIYAAVSAYYQVGNVLVIDGSTNTVVATIPVSDTPYEVAVNPVTNRIYVTDVHWQTTTVIDGETDTITGGLTLGAHPYGVAVNLASNRVYVTESGDDDIESIDGSTNQRVATFPTADNPSAIAVNPSTNRIYVANSGSDSVSVIYDSINPVTTIPVGAAPRGIVVNPGSNRVYVANEDSSTVSVIDAVSNSIVTTIPVGRYPRYVALNPLTDRIYVANQGDDIVSIIDGATNQVVGAVGVGDYPVGIAVNPSMNTIYVANYLSGNVSVIDGTSNTVTTTIPAGEAGVYGPFDVAVNPATNRLYVSVMDVGESFNHMSLLVIDGDTNTPAATMPLDCRAIDIAVNPATNRIYACDSVIDGATNTVVDTLVRLSQFIEVNPATNRVYASSSGGEVVWVIDGATNTLVATLLPGAAVSLAGSVAPNPTTNRLYVASGSWRDKWVLVLEDSLDRPCGGSGGLSIDKVEFTQAIQEWQTPDELSQYLAAHNGEPPVPIVSRKPAFLRVYLEEVHTSVRAKVQITFDPPIDGVTPRVLDLQPHCTPEQQRRQENGCESFDFYFTPPVGSWSAALTLFDKDNNELESHTFNVTSRNTRAMVFEPVSVCHGLLSGDCGDARALGGLLRFFKVTAPTHSVQFAASSSVLYMPSGWWWWERVVNRIWMDSWGHTDRYFVGMVHPGVPGTTGGVARLGSHAAAVRTSWIPPESGDEMADQAVAHETGHMLGRQPTGNDFPRPSDLDGDGDLDACWGHEDDHDNWPYDDNSIQQVGFDVSRRKAILPERAFDWMSYCEPMWVSPYTYNAVMDGLTTSGEAQAQSQVHAAFWQISGVFGDASLLLDPLWALETEGPTDAGSGSHRIDVVDGGNDVLFARWFEPVSPQAQELMALIFAELVPVQQGAARIIIRDPDNNELASISLAGTAPTVSVTFPTGGETLSGEHELTWQVTDPDSAAHIFQVEYSADAGASWHGLSTNIGEPALTVNFDDLPGCSNNCLVRVLASDGVNTGVGVSDPFSVPTKGPTAEVVFPEDDSLFEQGDLVWLQGSASDPDDGYLEGAALSWQSSRDGFLGNGDSLPLTSLSEGTHIITFTATDTEDNTASDSLSIQVDASPPVLGLTVVPDGTPASCVQVTIDATDEPGGSTLEAVEYSLDGGETWNPGCLSGHPFRFIAPGQGFIHLVARAADAAGNSTVKDEEFFIETECPSLDSDTDYIPDASDNCALVGNLCQENTDADAWGDACDYCPTTATPWYVPLGDEDCDGFTTTIEQYVGTDPLDACRDNPSDAAWPLDVNNDGGITVVADVLNFRGRIGATPGAPSWWQRLDFNADGLISVVGDVLMYRGRIGDTCT